MRVNLNKGSVTQVAIAGRHPNPYTTSYGRGIRHPYLDQASERARLY